LILATKKAKKLFSIVVVFSPPFFQPIKDRKGRRDIIYIFQILTKKNIFRKHVRTKNFKAQFGMAYHILIFQLRRLLFSKDYFQKKI
jgi:hypothetical protein